MTHHLDVHSVAVKLSGFGRCGFLLCSEFAFCIMLQAKYLLHLFCWKLVSYVILIFVGDIASNSCVVLCMGNFNSFSTAIHQWAFFSLCSSLGINLLPYSENILLL